MPSSSAAFEWESTSCSTPLRTSVGRRSCLKSTSSNGFGSSLIRFAGLVGITVKMQVPKFMGHREDAPLHRDSLEVVHDDCGCVRVAKNREAEEALSMVFAFGTFVKSRSEGYQQEAVA